MKNVGYQFKTYNKDITFNRAILVNEIPNKKKDI